MMEKLAFNRRLKLVLASVVIFCFLFNPVQNTSLVQAGMISATTRSDESSDTESACNPLDIVVAIDQSSKMNSSEDLEGLRIEAVKYMIKVLAQNEMGECYGTTDRISVIYIGDPDKTSVQIELTPISEDLIARLQPEDRGSRDFNTALNLVDLQLKLGERSRQDNAKSVVILISSWLGSPLLAGQSQTPSATEGRISELKSKFDGLAATDSHPSFHIIGISPKNPDADGYFANNEERWNETLGENGEFSRVEVAQMFTMAEDLISIIQDAGNRGLTNSGCAAFTVAPFTKNYDIFVFSNNQSANARPVFERGTFNSVLPNSLTRSFEEQDISEGYNIKSTYYSLNDSGVGGRVSYPNGCESTVVFSQSSLMGGEQILLENPIPRIFDTGNPDEDKYKLIFTSDDDDTNINWEALCPAYDFNFDVDIKDSNGQSIDWDSSFICDAASKRFISEDDLPNSEEGDYSVEVVSTASSNSIDPEQILALNGSYSVKIKQRIGFIPVLPRAEETAVDIPIHGALFSKYWLKEQPLTVTVQLVNHEFNDAELNPVTLNNDQPLKTITATIVENDSVSAELTEHEFNLLQSPTDPTVYSGSFSDFNDDISEYSMYVSLPEDFYNHDDFSHQEMGIQFSRQDDLFHNPITYYSLFVILLLAIAVWAFFFFREFVNPLRGYLSFYMPGNLSVPIGRFDLALGHKKQKIITEKELTDKSPLLEGISKLDVESVYQDGSLNAVNLGIYYPDMRAAQTEFLGAITINHDSEKNQWTLGKPIAESMVASVKTKTGSMIVFTKE